MLLPWNEQMSFICWTTRLPGLGICTVVALLKKKIIIIIPPFACAHTMSQTIRMKKTLAISVCYVLFSLWWLQWVGCVSILPGESSRTFRQGCFRLKFALSANKCLPLACNYLRFVPLALHNVRWPSLLLHAWPSVLLPRIYFWIYVEHDTTRRDGIVAPFSLSSPAVADPIPKWDPLRRLAVNVTWWPSLWLNSPIPGISALSSLLSVILGA